MNCYLTLYYQECAATYVKRVLKNCKSWVEEVSMKWMNRPSVTEMERGGVYEVD